MRVQVGFWQEALSAAIHHEQILHVVGLLELVEHRGLRIRAHAGRAQLVDRPAGREQIAVDRSHFDPGGFEHFKRGLNHVFRHPSLVVADLVVESRPRRP